MLHTDPMPQPPPHSRRFTGITLPRRLTWLFLGDRMVACIVCWLLLALLGSTATAETSPPHPPASATLIPVPAPESPPLLAPDNALYDLEQTGDGLLRQIPKISLVPPGSSLVHREITFDEMAEQPDGEELRELARVDLDFFGSRLRQELPTGAEAALQEAVFNVYRDFFGRQITELISATYLLK